MTTIKLHGPVDLETLADCCRGVNCQVTLVVVDGVIALRLSGGDVQGCAELLRDWLEIESFELVY